MDWLPAAVRDPHPRTFPWTDTTAPKGCLHTTESESWPTYQGWTIMPHATVMPTAHLGVDVRQHLPFSQASFALRHLDAQPTNGDFVFQFELVGTCDLAGPGYYWPTADDTVLLDLWRKVIQPLDDANHIPFRAPVWKAYPGSYGTSNGVRLGDTAFDVYTGWLGHQHVPQNDHGDPGAFPWARLVSLVRPMETVAGPVKLGDRGASVRVVQRHVGVIDDGIFGAATLAAVKVFQSRHHLAPDGIVGKLTAAAMGVRYVAARAAA